MSKTQEELRALKADWQSDPLWDIEDTEGFEEYKDELLAFRKECEAEWKKAREYRLARSTQVQIDAAMDSLEWGDNCGLSQLDRKSSNYLAAIAHSLLAIAAELRRANDSTGTSSVD